MKILSVNAGSSSLKIQLFEMPEGEVLVSAVFERIGSENGFYSININGVKTKKEIMSQDHEESVNIFLKELIELKIVNKLEDIEGIGHRVVHGADKYSKSVVIDEEVIKDIKEFSILAPLHNPANLLGISAFKKALPNVLMIAIFDTAFHQTMAEDAFIYAVPYEWYEKYGVRKYGFHGTSHQYVSEKAAELLNRNDLKLITCHLGNGGSISAVKNGKCLDTSMGFTPNAGIAMGTRCGDIDVSIVQYIMKQTGKSIDEVMNDLNKNSGLLGVSGLSNDARDIQDAIANGDARSRLAMDIYINRVVSYISYYNTLLDGADAIIFTAGLGENDKDVRREVTEMLKPLGMILDPEKNNVRGKETVITTPDSKIVGYLIPTNEELMIAKEVYNFSH
ncbi:MAG: acetate kinase [Bacilli bacterium]|nr:acetate kinase [Bacilli bacterium]